MRKNNLRTHKLNCVIKYLFLVQSTQLLVKLFCKKIYANILFARIYCSSYLKYYK